jgi:hypothetical protein
VNEERPTVWTRLESLSDTELRALVEASIEVLQQDGAASVEDDVLELPPGALRRELRSALIENGVEADEHAAEEVLQRTEMSRPVALALLGEIAREPALAQEIEAAYRARQGMMVVDPATLLAGALLVLALKLKRVKVGDVDVSFYPMKERALTAVRDILAG